MRYLYTVVFLVLFAVSSLTCSQSNIKPIIEEPDVEQPATADPATEQPATEQPATEQPTTEQPATEQPATEEPATADPGLEEPITMQDSAIQLISNHVELQAIRDDIRGHYRLTNNISIPQDFDFEPIESFSGIMEGSGFTISGLNLQESTKGRPLGLFRRIYGNEISNLTLSNCSIAGIDNVGSLVGKVWWGKIDVSTDCVVSGSGDHVGALVGFNEGGVVSGHATGTVTGADNTGGLVGWNAGTVTGYTTGYITGDEYVGGLVGGNSASVLGFATGRVLGNGKTGGLVGENAGTVTGYATGMVTGEGNYVAGLVGWNTGIVTGYATGEVHGDEYVGGLVGWNNDGTVIGYARGILRRLIGFRIRLGKVIGAGPDTTTIYHSETESIIYSSKLYDNVLSSAIGHDGTAVTIISLTSQATSSSTTQATFSELTFDSDIGSWTWLAGKWPAINIGDFAPAEEQPLDP